MKALNFIGVIVWIMLGVFLILGLSVEFYRATIERQTLIEEQNQTQLLIKGLNEEIQGLNGEIQSMKADFTVLPNPELHPERFMIVGWEPDK